MPFHIRGAVIRIKPFSLSQLVSVLFSQSGMNETCSTDDIISKYVRVFFLRVRDVGG
jgi:hypothetical protein